MIGALAYSSFVLEAFLHTGLSPLRSYVSELSVADRPYAFLFHAGDITAGCGLLALAMALARRLPATRGRASGCVALAVTAAASIGDGLWPMPCAPSVDPVCRATDSADLDQQLGQIHTLSSLAGFTGAILAMLLLSKVLQRTGHRRPARWSLRAGVATAALGALEIAMALTGVCWVGLPERAQVVLVSAWCAAMARFLMRIPPVSAHRHDPTAAPSTRPSPASSASSPADPGCDTRPSAGQRGRRGPATDVPASQGPVSVALGYSGVDDQPGVGCAPPGVSAGCAIMALNRSGITHSGWFGRRLRLDGEDGMGEQVKGDPAVPGVPTAHLASRGCTGGCGRLPAGQAEGLGAVVLVDAGGCRDCPSPLTCF
ncbi:DUF998 domain-containing protein [Streptomyces sp. NPDC048362]|uniref:DUF998 domain-containing protein n=1 Tax=Streptomyces sp. NPDC048362 TaxID=3365539 RepID=UPI003720F6BD